MLTALLNHYQKTNFWYFNIMSWSHMTNHVMNLTWLRQFHTITYPKVNLLLIIGYPTYLTFLVNLPKQPFESTYVINFFIELMAPLAYDDLFVEAWGVSPSNIPWFAVWMKALLDVVKTSPLCKRQLCFLWILRH